MTRQRYAIQVGVLVLLTLCSLPPAFSQLDQSALLSATSVSTTTSNYYFAKPNELTIIVNIIGFIQKPGRYEISSSIDLINLLSLAGGPTPDGSMKDVKITRFVGASGRMERKEVLLDLDQLAGVNPAQLVLQPGDIIQVDRTGWSTFRDVFSVVVSAAILTTAVAQVISLTR